MYAETSEKKMSQARVAFALLCGLAVCCSVMYITADGEQMYVHEMIDGKQAGTSVGSTDVLKAGEIYTETPNGRMRLIDYFNNVEKEIGDEVANRKSAIAAVRAQMARDFAFNAAARARLKRQMLYRMAVNAKICRDDLNRAMMKTQERFAKQAWLANSRQRATQHRDKKTLDMINSDRKEEAHNLRLAVSGWQTATSSWASATNAKIDRMNKHVAANAAQIKENAKKARKDLENAMGDWDHKIAKFSKHESSKNSQLSAQFTQQDKATRAWADNKVKALVASTASQFNDVYAKMAKNRHAIDMALKHAAQKFAAALNAQKALQNKRFAETQRDISAAKAEAKSKVAAATADYKVRLLQLHATVTEQVTKVNNNIDKTAGVVRSNKAAQAKVNANVNAEMTRMIKLGNKRYKDSTKKDLELHKLINKNQEKVDGELKTMADAFNAALGKVRKQLAKDRAHAEHRLKSSTDKVWAALYAANAKQAKKNAKLEANIRRMRLDAMNNVRAAKKQFKEKIHKLAAKVALNDKKADKKIEHLTGLVKKNAMKSKMGRDAIQATEDANKAELKTAIRKAIAKGEKRAQLVEMRGTKMDKDTKWLVTNKLNTEITALRKSTDASVEALRLQSKEARAQSQKEMLYAIRSASKLAHDDLKIAIRTGADKMVSFETKAAKSTAKSALERKALGAEIAANAKSVSRMIQDAMSTVAQAQTCMRAETQGKIKKGDMRVDAYAQRMIVQADATKAHMKKTIDATMKEVQDELKKASAVAKKFTSADAAREASALKFVTESIEAGKKSIEGTFYKKQVMLAHDRADADTMLASATRKLNDALAKQAAIMDSRFSKTVKNLSSARKQAGSAVVQLRKDFATSLALVTAEVSKVETLLINSISVVSGEIISASSNHYRVSLRVEREIARILKLANVEYSTSKRARGKLKILMDENKAAASDEVHALAKSLKSKLSHAEARKIRTVSALYKDLAIASQSLYEKMASSQKSSADHVIDQSKVAVATDNFKSKIAMLANAVASGAKRAERDMTSITGVVHNIDKAAAADRPLIAACTKMAVDGMNAALTGAIMFGEARGKAVEQRIAIHRKDVKRWLQIELAAAVDRTADEAFADIQADRQKIADNYLSLKAYAVSAADKVVDQLSKGQGRYLSSVGDLLQTVGSLGAVKPRPAEGLGMGGDKIPTIFSGSFIKVPTGKAPINGLVNEYTDSCKQVRERWPMGLGKYLLDRLEVSMMGKGVLQVDKVPGKSGNFVYMNGGSVGLSSKLNDFASLAVGMSDYESALAHLTSKLSVGPKVPTKSYVKPPEWDGN